MPANLDVETDSVSATMASPKQRHRCGPRVKTGCLTCRVRRVKCDEARPACNRCTTTGRQCDGYAHIMHEFKATVIQPESKGQQSSFGQIDSYEIPFSIPGSQRDRQLFHYYCAHGAKDLAGYLDTTLWYDLVLMYSEKAPVVRQAVIAFSATQLQLVQGQNHILPDGTIEHLKQYDKAVRWLRKYISTTNRLKPRVVLTTCALLFATCIARGEMEEAFQHVDSGLLILRNANELPQKNTSSIQSRETSPMPSECSGSSGEEDLNPVPDEIKKFFEHVEKELGVHEMVRGLSRPPVGVSVLATRSPQHCRAAVEAALRLATTRLTRLLHSTTALSTTADAHPSSPGSLLDNRIPKTLQLVNKWSHMLSCMTYTTQDTNDYQKIRHQLEIVQKCKKRLSILSLDIWLSILRSAFPESIQVWTMCPNPLVEAFIVLRERIAAYVLSWIADVSGKAVDDDILRTSIELSVVVPLTLLAEHSTHEIFSQTVHRTLNVMLTHRLYDADKATTIFRQLSTRQDYTPGVM